MRRSLLAVAAVVVGSASASACAWDSELIRHEKEFRSGYQQPKQRAEPPDTVKRALPWAMGGVGAVLLLAGGVSVARNFFRG